MGTTIFNKAFAETELCTHLDRYVTVEGWKKLNKYKETGEVEFQGNSISFTELQNFLGLEFGWKDGKNFSKFWVSEGRSMRNFNAYQKDTMDEYFDKARAPLYLDQEEFQKRLLLSSQLLFYSNEKICLSVMVEREHIGKWWNAGEIIKECGKYGNTDRFRVDKIEECLNRHCNTNVAPFLYDREELPKVQEDGSRYRYRLRLSDLILYNNNSRF